MRLQIIVSLLILILKQERVASDLAKAEDPTAEKSNINEQTNLDPDLENQLKKKPNILLILADDVGTEDVPGYWGNHIVEMPNIEKLQSQGVTFLDVHSTPLCAPSRYMLLSGNYQHRGLKTPSAWNFWDGQNQFLHNQQSIAQVLKESAGYHTWMAGKWHIGLGTPNGQWDHTHLLSGIGANWTNPVTDGPNDIGFDQTYYTAGGIQEAPYAFFRNGILETDLSNVVLWPKGKYKMEGGLSAIRKEGEGDKAWDSTTYNMKVVNETKAFLDHHMENRAADPFFAYVALGAVHKPHSPPDYYMDGTPVAGQYANPHFDVLFEMDKVVGSLIRDIEDRGLAEDTIIIFASDNGGLSSDSYEHKTLRGHKGQIYEGGHRVPLVFRYDGHWPKGETRTSKFVGLNDVYATLADIVDAPVPPRSAQDSVSFASYIESEENTDGLREYLGVWAYKNYGEKVKFKLLQAESLRYKNLKVVKHNEPRKFIELFDLEKDLGETKNIAEDKIHEATLNDMLNELKRLGPCPEGNLEPFYLSRGQSKGRRTMCNWFRKKKRRCNHHIEGELHCNPTCGRFRYMCDFQNM